MKLLLVSGHTPGHNKWAATEVNEGDLNVELCMLIQKGLSGLADVHMYPTGRDMYKDLKGGQWHYAESMDSFDYIFEVHFNASGNHSARGCSIYLHTNYTGGISVERGILDRIAACGVSLRGNNGINRKDTLLNMNRALKAGIDYALIETLFYDNVADMEFYKQNKHVIANAIAQGIAEGFGLDGDDEPGYLTPADPETPANPDEIYRVQVGAFRNLEYAKGLQGKLRDAGFIDTRIVKATT